jgi:hypothetical protein
MVMEVQGAAKEPDDLQKYKVAHEMIHYLI